MQYELSHIKIMIQITKNSKKKTFIVIYGLLLIFLGQFLSQLIAFFYGEYLLNAHNSNIALEIIHPSPLHRIIITMQNCIFFSCCFFAGIFIGRKVNKRSWVLCGIVSICSILPTILYNLIIVIGYSLYPTIMNSRLIDNAMHNQLQSAFIAIAWSHITSFSLYFVFPVVFIGGIIGEKKLNKLKIRSHYN